ncbi:SRPBCC family protein [Ilumatobacter coccineus]|uniref:Putative oxidoreductase n=1 Tax=Ilumatobacter coccineus (strain NBRC 103263 / KCTC 29153 / YM16-304) TaxID=1313172 RepID=A0A6C7E0F7_ILUCY|nr:SRPBCC family protein [Ilumatobacter coccineus]BAN00483.1 putative oxidoreductase [Ilumatobacter coccineus YM16-304]
MSADQHASPPLDAAAVDHALTTTRAVRRRLDLERPVDDDIIFDCIDIAEQAPTGGDQSSRRWVIVRDPELKARLADLYLASGGEWMIDTRDRLAGTGHPRERVMASAAHLAEHLAEVPAIVIPTIIGLHDGSGRPGLFDSVIQSAWSLCVALRARGLGTTWTTAILERGDELSDLLGIPADNTPIAMIPVAWTIGTDFRPAPRRPAREIAFIDRYGHTWASGPSNPPSLLDGPGTVVEIDIDAPPHEIWQYVTDVNFAAKFSRELQRAAWDVDGEPEVGATFTGSNENSYMGEWDVTCHVVEYEADRCFAWSTVSPDDPGATWRYELEPLAGSTRLRHSVVIGPGPSGLKRFVESNPDRAAQGITGRMSGLRDNMNAVVAGIKSAAEN